MGGWRARPGLRTAARILGALLMVASLYYVGRTLYGGVRDLALGEVAIRWVPLAGALALTTVCVGLGAGSGSWCLGALACGWASGSA